jgi:hypothetical protein
MDVIISKKMLEHMKSFFKEDKNGAPHEESISDTTTKKIMKSKSFKKKQSHKNRTMKKI